MWKVTERIKELNTKRASPKSAMDLDVMMTESRDESVNGEAVAGTDATNFGFVEATKDLTGSVQAGAGNTNMNPPGEDDEVDDASIDLLLDTDTELLP